MAKLSWEYTDRNDQIVIRKPKGKLTVEEIVEFLNEREQRYAFGEGTLCVIAWRIKDGDTYQGFDWEKNEGDSQEVWVLGDEAKCFCGRTLHTQYCPECGHKLWDENPKATS